MERLETMRRNVMGNGLSQCLLCGEVLGFLGSSSVFCKDCRKVRPCSGFPARTSPANSWLCVLTPRRVYVCADTCAGLPGGSAVKNPPAHVGDAGSIPGLGSSPREGNGQSLQCSCLGSSMDREAWQATVHGVAESDMT